MRTLDTGHPFAVTVYFICVSAIPMFRTDPAIAAAALSGAVLYDILRNGKKHLTAHAVCFGLFVLLTLINPLFQHNGRTVLFVLNDNPVTLEALIYGAVSAASLLSAVHRFRSFSEIMTSDKLICLFSSFSPKTALLLSMALRYIPLVKQQAAGINASQKALGLYREDNAIDTARGGMRVFSILTTWTLENGIITADSMSARGYGTGRRTSFSLYTFKKQDALLIVVAAALTAVPVYAILRGGAGCTFYPQFAFSIRSGWPAAGYIAYAALSLLPSFIEAGDRIKWHYLKSKI